MQIGHSEPAIAERADADIDPEVKGTTGQSDIQLTMNTYAPVIQSCRPTPRTAWMPC